MKITGLTALAAALGATAIASAIHVGLGHEGIAACLPEVAFGTLAATAAAAAGLRAMSLASQRKGA